MIENPRNAEELHLYLRQLGVDVPCQDTAGKPPKCTPAFCCTPDPHKAFAVVNVKAAGKNGAGWSWASCLTWLPGQLVDVGRAPGVEGMSIEVFAS